jgi:hypothetical protein
MPLDVNVFNFHLHLHFGTRKRSWNLWSGRSEKEVPTPKAVVMPPSVKVRVRTIVEPAIYLTHEEERLLDRRLITHDELKRRRGL